MVYLNYFMVIDISGALGNMLFARVLKIERDVISGRFHWLRDLQSLHAQTCSIPSIGRSEKIQFAREILTMNNSLDLCQYGTKTICLLSV